MVGMPVACMKDIREVKDMPQDTICERTGEQISSLVPRVTREILYSQGVHFRAHKGADRRRFWASRHDRDP